MAQFRICHQKLRGGRSTACRLSSLFCLFHFFCQGSRLRLDLSSSVNKLESCHGFEGDVASLSCDFFVKLLSPYGEARFPVVCGG